MTNKCTHKSYVDIFSAPNSPWLLKLRCSPTNTKPPPPPLLFTMPAKISKKSKKKKSKKSKGSKSKSSQGAESAEESPMVMAIAAMKEHKSFGQMVKYNLSALLLSVVPGHAGWEDNCADFVRLGGMAVLTEIIEIHAKKGNKEILDMATVVLKACTSHPELRKAFTLLVIQKRGASKILGAAQRVPKLEGPVANIMQVVEHCADTNARMMANAEHLKPLIKNMDVFADADATLATTARVINKILRSKDAMAVFAELGGVEAIIGVFRSGTASAATTLPLLLSLDRLCIDPANVERYIAIDGTFEVLLDVIDNMSGEADVLNIAGRLLNKIAGTSLDGYLAELQGGGLEVEVQDRLIRIVAALAVDPKNAKVINETDGAMAALIALLDTSAGVSDAVLPVLVQILARCATTDDAAWGIIELGAIEAIVAAMQANEENHAFQASACRALGKLATSGRAVEALSVKAGVTEVIAALTRDHEILDVALAALDFVNTVGNVPLMEEQLEALINELVAAEAVQGVLYAIDAEPLTEDGLANADHPPLATAAMKALTFLSRESPEAHEIIMEGSAVDWAIYNLANEATAFDEAVIDISLTLLTTLAEDPATNDARPECVEAIIEKGAVDPVVMALFNHPDHEAIQDSGASLIRLIVSQDAVEAMVANLRKSLDALKGIKHPDEDDTRAVEVPAMALAAFASWNSAAIIEGGGIAALVELLKWCTAQRNLPRQEEVMTACLRALKNLAADKDEDSAATLFEWIAAEDGVPAVTAAVRKHPKLKKVTKAGIKLMAILALTPDSHNELINAEAIEAAMNGVNSNPDKVKLNMAVVNMFDELVKGEDGAKAVAERGGCKALTEILRRKAALPTFIEPTVRTFEQIVAACNASSTCAATLRKQNVMGGIIVAMQDQHDERVYVAGTKAIDALLNDEAVRLAVLELKTAVQQTESGELKSLVKLTVAQRVVGFMVTADRYSDKIVRLGGPASLVKALCLVDSMPANKSGRTECLTAGIEACGLLGGRISAQEYSPAVPTVLRLVSELRSAACLTCIDRLAGDNANVGAVLESGTVTEILNIIKEKGDDPDVARPGFSALATLAKDEVSMKAIFAAGGADVAREWLAYNLGDESQEAGAVAAIELLALLCSDEENGAALVADLNASGAMNSFLAEVFESTRNPSAGLISAALGLAGVAMTDKDELVATFVDTGRLRKLVDMYDTYGATGSNTSSLHGISADCDSLARRVIDLHNSMRRNELHEQCESEGMARLIDDIIGVRPAFAGLVDGKEPKLMLEDALRNIDSRLADGDDGGVENLDGLYTDLEKLNTCLSMEGALDASNSQWALAAYTDTLQKLRDVDADEADKDHESALCFEGLACLMEYDDNCVAGLRKGMHERLAANGTTGGDTLSFSDIASLFPESMSEEEAKALFAEFAGDGGALIPDAAMEMVSALAMPFAGMVQETAGYFEGGKTGKLATKLVSDLSNRTDVLHEMARAGTMAELVARYNELYAEAEESAAAAGRTKVSMSTEGNLVQKAIMQIYKNLAPKVAPMVGTEDEITVVDLYNCCPDPLMFSALRTLADDEEGMPVITKIAMGGIAGIEKPVELAACSMLTELLTKNGEEDDDALEPDMFMQLAQLAPKMHSAQGGGDNDEFESFMDGLEDQFAMPDFADELLAKQPDFLVSVKEMLASGEEGKVIVGSKLLAGFTSTLEQGNCEKLLASLKAAGVIAIVASDVAPNYEAYGAKTLMGNLDSLAQVAGVMEDDDAESWAAMGLTAKAYESLRPAVMDHKDSEDETDVAIYECGVQLLDMLQEKHEIPPEFNLDETIQDNFSAVHAALGDASDYECVMGDDGDMMFMCDGEEMDEPPPEYTAMMAGLDNMASCAEMCHGQSAEIAEEQMSSLCDCLAKHACDSEASLKLAKSLDALASNDANLTSMADNGGLEGIIKALIANPHNTPLLRVLIHLLEKFVKFQAFKLKIGSVDGCKALLMCLEVHCAPDYVSGEAIQDTEEVTETSVRGNLGDHKVMLAAMLSLLANLTFNCVENVDRCIAEEGVDKMHTYFVAYPDLPRLLEVVMCNFSNWMFSHEGVKKDIGEKCSEVIIAAVNNHHEDPTLVKMAMRALGNITTLEENIVEIMEHRAIEAIVKAMQSKECKSASGVQTIAIQVIGNMAASEDVELPGTDDTVAALILQQGGAHAVLAAAKDDLDERDMLVAALEALNYVCQDPAAATQLNEEGLCELVLDAMRAFDTDVEVIERCFDLFYTISFSPDCAEHFVNDDGLKMTGELMKKLGSKSEDGILIMGQASLHALLKEKPEADLLRYAKALHDCGGTQIVAHLVEKHLDNEEFLTEALETISRIAAHESLAHGSAMEFMPSLRAIALHYLSEGTDEAHIMLDRMFRVMGLFAFDKANIETIVLNQGLPLVLRAVAKYPREEQLMERVIKTIDFICLGDKDYTKVVISNGGKLIVEKILELYPDAEHIQDHGLRCIMALEAVEEDNLAEEEGIEVDAME